MQRLSKKLTLSAIVLALAPIINCVSLQNLDDKVNSFYSKKEVIETNKDTIITYYAFNNGIEVEVITNKENSRPRLIGVKVLKDPNNLIIKGTPKRDSAEGTTYELDLNGTRRLTFRFNDIHVYTTFVTEGEDQKTTVHYRSGGIEGDLAAIFVPDALRKLSEIEKALHIAELISY